mmetsp:Transcript_59081/g.158275  ORF Transcript_59081/g.158275 Transcript_59081/m.158275 type:complete len:243 (-) Transcript_59081:8-736(-)
MAASLPTPANVARASAAALVRSGHDRGPIMPTIASTAPEDSNCPLSLENSSARFTSPSCTHSGESTVSAAHRRTIRAFTGGGCRGASNSAETTPSTPEPATCPFSEGQRAAAASVSKMATLNSDSSAIKACASACMRPPPFDFIDWPMATARNADKPSDAANASAPLKSSHTRAHQPAAAGSSSFAACSQASRSCSGGGGRAPPALGRPSDAWARCACADCRRLQDAISAAVARAAPIARGD